jgi:hypothetical protein
MSTVMEIEAAIEQLPSREFEEVRAWLFRRDWPAQDDDIAVPRSYQQKVLNALDEP